MAVRRLEVPLNLLKDPTQFHEVSANHATFASMDYNHTLASVWAVSLSRLDVSALGLLRALSFHDPDRISASTLTASINWPWRSLSLAVIMRRVVIFRSLSDYSKIRCQRTRRILASKSTN